MMDNPIIQGLWIGQTLSIVEQLCIASFIHHGHVFHLYAYNEITNVPKGAILKDAKQIIAEKEIFIAHNGSYAAFSDWFRWQLLYQKGGFWVDMDIIALKPFAFYEHIIFGHQDSKLITPSVLGFPPGHKLCQFLANNCKNPHAFLAYDSWQRTFKKLVKIIRLKGRGDISWGEAGGPAGFTKALKHFNLSSLAKPYTYFYPVAYTSWQAIFDETFADNINLLSHAYAVHLWNEAMRREPNFDKNTSFSHTSLFGQLKVRYAGDLEL